VGLIGVKKNLAMKVHSANFTVLNTLWFDGFHSNLMIGPNRYKLFADLGKFVHNARRKRIWPLSGDGNSELCGEVPAVWWMIIINVNLSTRRVGKPPENKSSGQTSERSLIAVKRSCEPRLDESFTCTAHDLGRGIFQPIRDAHQPRTHMIIADRALRVLMANQQKQMIPISERQAKSACDCRSHLIRRFGAVAAFKSTIIVSGHTNWAGNFLSPQPSRSSSGTTRQANVFWLQSFPTFPKKVSEFGLVHDLYSSRFRSR
jgi:hypothetical protein